MRSILNQDIYITLPMTSSLCLKGTEYVNAIALRIQCQRCFSVSSYDERVEVDNIIDLSPFTDKSPNAERFECACTLVRRQ